MTLAENIENDPRWEWRRAARDYEHESGAWPATITLPVNEYQEALARGHINFNGQINWLDDSPPTKAQPGETKAPQLNRAQRRAQLKESRRNRLIETRPQQA